VPYFVMELIEGDPIDLYCDAHKLKVEERLQLFLQVCSAVQYAHQRQIIHRDIKPSNILVTQGGVPKLLDFGIAKILDVGFNPSVTGPTETQGRVFTPQYASPEQIRGEAVAAPSDVYSLGVLLYVLLTGQQPYRFRTPAPSEVERVICQEQPAKPSAATRAAEQASINDETASLALKSISVARGTEPAQLQRSLRGDLDAIVMMALRKEASRRYASAANFSDDIRRHLEGIAITARPGDLPYRTRRFLQRHREMVAGALASAILLGGVAGWRSRRAGVPPPRPASIALVQPRPSVAVLGFKNLSLRPNAAWLSTALSEMLTTELAAGEKVRTVPEEAVARAKADLSLPDVDNPGGESLGRLHKALGSDYVVSGSYLALEGKAGGQLRVDVRLQEAANGTVLASVSETGGESQLLDLMSRAGAQLRSKLGMDPVSSAESVRVGASLPASLEAMRFYSEGLAKFRIFDSRAARDLLQRAVAADPRFAPGRSALADVWSTLGYDQKAKDEAKKAFDLSADLTREEKLLIEARYRAINNENDRAVEIYKSLFEMFPDNLDYGLSLVDAERNASKSKDSFAILDALRKLPPPLGDDPRIDLYEAFLWNDMTNLKGSQAAAEKAAVRANALGERVVAARAYHEKGQVLYSMGNTDQAFQVLESASTLFEAVGDKFQACENDVSLAQLFYMQRDDARAKSYLTKALTLARGIGSRNGLMVAQNVMGNILRAEGDFKKAGAAYGESDSIAVELNEEPARTSPLDGLGWTAFDQGDLPRATQWFEKEIALAQKRHSLAGVSQGNTGLGRVSLARGDLQAARRNYTEALQVFENAKQQYRVAKGKVLLALVSIEEGHPGDAEGPLQEATQSFQTSKNGYGETLAATAMARALLAEGKAKEAEATMEKAAGALAKANSIDATLDYAIVNGQIHAALGRTAQAIQELRLSLETAKKTAFVPEQFEALLALCGAEMTAGQTALARRQLIVLEKDAESRGFKLIARKTAAAAKATH